MVSQAGSVTLSLCIFLFYPAADVTFAPQLDVYTVTEGAPPLPLCAEIVDGCLEREVEIEYATVDATAQSKFSYLFSSFFVHFV